MALTRVYVLRCPVFSMQLQLLNVDAYAVWSARKTRRGQVGPADVICA
jgi:hypothetical protein